MRKRVLLFLILFLTASLQASPKKYIFEKLNIQDGLSQSTIYNILQDNTGFIWFCTDNGLNRYDGKQFKKYFAYEDSLNSLSSNRIFCGTKDSYGYLWFGTEVGLNKFNPRTTIFEKYYSGENKNSLSDNTIRSVFEDKDSVLWVGTNYGLNRYNRATNDFTQIFFNQNQNRINFILEGKNDSTLWIGTSYYGLYEFNKYDFTYKLYEPKVRFNEIEAENKINVMKWIGKDEIYLGTDAGLVIFNAAAKRFTGIKSVLIERHSFSSDIITDIEVMPDSSIWLSTSKDGIIILDNNNSNPVVNLKQESNDRGSISNNRVLNIFVDKQNIVWIGTYSGGVNKYDRTTQKFNHYTETSDKLKLLSNEVWQIFEDSKQNIWVCTDEGLGVYNKNKELIRIINKTNSNISDNNIFTITEDVLGNYWIGTIDGLNKYNFTTGEIVKYYAGRNSNSLSSSTISYLYADKNYELWIGTSLGLNKIDVRSGKVTKFENEDLSAELTNDFITNIIGDHTGEYLWVGTLSGLIQFNKKTYVSRIFKNNPLNNKTISSDRIYGLLEDAFNNIWICTLGGGLNKYVRDENIFIHYRESDGLSNDLVYGIIEDNNNVLWMSTNYGITRFDPLKNEFTKYDVSNGLQSNEFNFNSFMKAKDGELYFGGVNGINSFYPDKIIKNNLVPDTKITTLKIYNKEISPIDDFRLKEDVIFADEIILDYNENIFTIEFSALNFSSPQKNQYKYIIEGLYDDWIFIENRNFASFSNIPPGSYLFRVKGSNNDNVWDEKGATLNIKILPPLWRTWWAYLGYVLILTGIIFLFLHLKLTSQQREIKALQKADKLKSEFLAQMSHEIRTPINVILSFAGLLKEEMDGKVSDDLKMGFQSIGNAGKRITRTIDLILNMSEIQSGTYDYKPEPINIFDDILLELSIEFRKMAEKKGLKLEIISKCNDPIIYADSYTVEQIFANLVDNAIKFTEKGSVNIYINCNAGKIIIAVEDTGKGIKQEYFSEIFSPFSQEEQGYTRRFEGNGLGLSLVKNYCEINKADINVESEYSKGTKFTVTFDKYNN